LALAREPFIVAAELSGTAAQARILLAAPISLAEIELASRLLPGVVLDVEDTLVPGPSVRPVPPPEPRDFGGRPPAVEDDDRYPSRDEPSEQEPSHSEMQGDAGRLKLSLIPSDATVYLDGHFLGTATELSRLHAGLLLDAGSHRLEIVRPGYKSVEKRVNVRAGEEIELEIQLEEAE
ncbi:MAG TPA: PEGA domain-containing protein, partial [Thermoanaerobaculia bacterium]|nr:PEGA domain-containing protein [Thermoanaerobaculia bacterium]